MAWRIIHHFVHLIALRIYFSFLSTVALTFFQNRSTATKSKTYFAISRRERKKSNCSLSQSFFLSRSALLQCLLYVFLFSGGFIKASENERGKKTTGCRWVAAIKRFVVQFQRARSVSHNFLIFPFGNGKICWIKHLPGNCWPKFSFRPFQPSTLCSLLNCDFNFKVEIRSSAVFIYRTFSRIFFFFWLCIHSNSILGAHSIYDWKPWE